MEVAVEVEDDVFFADLSKQLSILIMDDEEESAAHYPSLSLQAFSQAIRPATQTSISYEVQTCRRESKGTGVFIPRLSQPRRSKNRQQGRHYSSNAKFHRQLDNSKGSQHVPFNSNSSYDSFNHRRF